MITIVPAVVLFVEYGAFTNSLDYYRDSHRVLWAILGYGTLVSVASSILLVGMAVLFQRTLPLLIAWGVVFILLPGIERILNAILLKAGSEGWAWGVINFWRVMGWMGNLFFGIRSEVYWERLPWAVSALTVWLGLSLWVFWRKVHAVEVVK